MPTPERDPAEAERPTQADPAGTAEGPAAERRTPTGDAPAPARSRVVTGWVRLRLRAAPGAAVALGLLVLLTSFLAAAFPRGIDAYQPHAIREQLSDAAAARSAYQITSGPPGAQRPQHERAAALAPGPLAAQYRALRERLPDLVRTDDAQSARGVRTPEPLVATDAYLPRPDGLPPKLSLTAQSGLPEHSTVKAGRMPRGANPFSDTSEATGRGPERLEIEVAVTADTAKGLHLRLGSLIHLNAPGTTELSAKVVGILAPKAPELAYWSVDPLLAAPGLTSVTYPGDTPKQFWVGGLLLAPEAGPALLAANGAPETFWRLANDPDALTGRDVSRLRSQIASLESGPDLVELRKATGPGTEVSTDVDAIVADFGSMRDAVAPVVAVAAFGVGTVAAVVLLMAGGLAAARRRAELTLLRSRGGSLAGVGRRLLAETSVIALPAAVLGCAIAVVTVRDARLLPALLAAAAVAALACFALPVRAVAAHRRPLTSVERTDAVRVRPSRQRTVAELTGLVLAVGAVVALRQRGTANGEVDALVSAAPVLIGAIAAMLLVRLYPLPLRLATRPANRRRGAVGFLALARAGRAPATGALPLLALITALTTASFGGSVLAGVSDARERASLLAVGADARVDAHRNLPKELAASLRAVRGVQQVLPAHIEYDLQLNDDGSEIALVVLDPDAYNALAGKVGTDRIPADALRGKRGPVVPAIASPGVAKRMGKGPQDLRPLAGDITVQVAAVHGGTPATQVSNYLLVSADRLPGAAPTTLLMAGSGDHGSGIDAAALRAAVQAATGGGAAVEAPAGGSGTGDGSGSGSGSESGSAGSGDGAATADGAQGDSAGQAGAAGGNVRIKVRAEEHAALSDSPLQGGTERLYAAAVTAGAGYAALAVLLSLLQATPERTALLARLRTMGLNRRQGRRLLVLEALPQALLAAGGGALVGYGTIQLLAPGLDLTRLALSARTGFDELGTVRLHADALSLLIPAVGVVVLALLVVLAQAWWSGRRKENTELRVGETR
ncbi:FtsX-like permease family protein [Streptomyces sp. HSW2009]|uniref:FtsX-like permease family protein n=1 Tax=Streptomyces sp. HSW2009 TaxID=3142890 RepID=UPI0032EAE8AB